MTTRLITRALVAVTLCLLPLRAAWSQALLVLLFGDKFASENVQGGIKFDVVGTTLAGVADAARLRSWDLGGFIEVKLGGRWSIQPEFTFKSPAGARGLPFVPTGADAVDSAFATARDVSVTRTLGYITIPILVKLRAGRFGLGIGPQLGLHSMRIRLVWYHAFGDALSDGPGKNDTFGVGFGLPIGGPRQAESPK